MTQEKRAFTVNIDGASRGNPGPAAYAFVISHDGAPLLEESACLGSTTNNLAEYTSLVRALERSLELGAQSLHIRSDSELLVKQIKGEYRIKNENLKPLYDQAKDLMAQLDHVRIEHVRREHNREADRLCNEALDGRPTNLAGIQLPKPEKKSPKSSPIHKAREEAIACLNDALDRSADADETTPTAEALWDQLWQILQRNGIV